MVFIKIAIYGKGGIGKSTISANVSAALADSGNRVFQIGCDPKHDSTRLLLGGMIPITVLQYIKNVLPSERRPEDIVYRGYRNVACVEAGGPEPGVGCAGRGIITTFELLENLGIYSSLFDITVYDVLGDVVCGGFAVPIRSEYADAIYVVTSGEYLSLYAANNIIRGIKNYTDGGNRIAGIIFNARGGQEEAARVARFAEKVSLPVVVMIPRSGIFARAEEEGCTLIEKYPQSSEAEIFKTLADHVNAIRNNQANQLFPAKPLMDDDLEKYVLLRKDSHPINKFSLSTKREDQRKCITPSVKKKHPLIGCAFTGAVTITSRITDAATVMHCPRSCLLTAYERIIGSELRSGSFSIDELKRRLVSTDMTDEDFIFSGEKKLHCALESVINSGFKTIFIVTACPPGIIGDDISKVSSDICRTCPNVQIIPIKVDGNLAGDLLQGIVDAYQAVSELIPADDIPVNKNRSVNIIGEMWSGFGLKKNQNGIFDNLHQLGITINQHFLARTTIHELKQFNQARLNLTTRHDDVTEGIKKVIESVTDVPFLKSSLPTGFLETSEWLVDIARVFEDLERSLLIIEEEKIEYQNKINQIKPHLVGKTLLISTYPQNLNWIVEIALDLGMIVLKAGVKETVFLDKPTFRNSEEFLIVKDYSLEMQSEDIRILQPDLVVCTHSGLLPHDKARSWSIPFFPGYGFHAAIDLAEEWARLMRETFPEGWKQDQELIY